MLSVIVIVKPQVIVIVIN